MRPIAGLACALAAAAAAPAAAGTYTVSILGPMDLGTVVTAATGDTVFRVDAGTGAVTVQSGSGRRITAASARTQVQLTCRPDRVGDTSCDTDKVPVRVGAIGALTGRARALRNFSAGMGGSTMAGPSSGSGPLSFKLAAIGSGAGVTLTIGADFPVAGDDSGLPSGDGTNGFFVYVTDNSGQQQLAGDTNNGKVRALRALAIAKGADLNFGRIQRPTSGNSTVKLDAATGARTVSGNGAGYATPAPTPAAFTISGEGGQQVSLTIPTRFNLTGPATLAVNVNSTASATPVLSGTLGAGGSYSFTVGGAFAITNTTGIGAYTGMLTVSVDYN